MNRFSYIHKVRSSHRRSSVKKNVSKNFAILTGKPLYRSLFSIKFQALEALFNNVSGLQACNFIKKRHRHRCFSVNIAKFLKTPILKYTCDQLLLRSGCFCLMLDIVFSMIRLSGTCS